MTTFVTIIHVLVCAFLIGVVLLQSGRAGGMGVLSGAATQTVFGGRGAGGFLQKVTAVCAILFVFTCSLLAWSSSSKADRLRNVTQTTSSSVRAATPVPTADAGSTSSSNTPASTDASVFVLPELTTDAAGVSTSTTDGETAQPSTTTDAATTASDSGSPSQSAADAGSATPATSTTDSGSPTAPAQP